MRRYLPIAVTLAALLLSGCGRESDPPPPADPTAGELVLHDAGEKPIVDPTRRPRKPGYIGVISAHESSEVAAKVPGELAQVHVRLGDKVEPGDLIATIDDRQIREELAISEAAARTARARISQARVDVEEAKQQLAIEKRAFANGTASQKAVIEAEFRVKKTQAARDRTNADLGEQRARVTQLRRRLGDAKITAPFAGTVSLRHLDPGAVVQPGTPIIRLITTDELWVKFAVPGDDANKLAVEQAIKVEIEAIETELAGTIRQIAPELEPSSQMIIVEGDLDISDGDKDRIQSGLVARVMLGPPPGTTEEQPEPAEPAEP